MNKIKIAAIALIMLSLVSCRDATPDFSLPATQTVNSSRRSHSQAGIVSLAVYPEPEPEPPEEIPDEPEEDSSDENIFEHTAPQTHDKEKDYISAIKAYEKGVSEYNSKTFESLKDQLTEFISVCSPLNILSEGAGMVYSYYSGYSSTEMIAPAAAYRGRNIESLYAQKPDISVYYYDLITGDEFSYNENEVRDSASLAKIPYLLSVLEEISAFEKTSGDTPDYSGNNSKYNLDEKWVYDSKTMYKSGSGVLFEKPDGTEASWKELFSYSFRNSDNIAYAQIKNRFGKGSYYSLLTRLGIEIPTDERFLTAREYGEILREVYSFCENDSRLGLFMKEEILSVELNNIIGRCYAKGYAAHKYGWDLLAYHDMAVIYTERPYIIVIMTNYDTGGDAVDRYICDIVRLLQRIHDSTE